MGTRNVATTFSCRGTARLLLPRRILKRVDSCVVSTGEYCYVSTPYNCYFFQLARNCAFTMYGLTYVQVVHSTREEKEERHPPQSQPAKKINRIVHRQK